MSGGSYLTAITTSNSILSSILHRTSSLNMSEITYTAGKLIQDACIYVFGPVLTSRYTGAFLSVKESDDGVYEVAQLPHEVQLPKIVQGVEDDRIEIGLLESERFSIKTHPPRTIANACRSPVTSSRALSRSVLRYTSSASRLVVSTEISKTVSLSRSIFSRRRARLDST
jgi:hypothetical protein